jgi:hypothetical protein
LNNPVVVFDSIVFLIAVWVRAAAKISSVFKASSSAAAGSVLFPLAT